ncbi:MAG: hemerythrin [Verrucomicrobiaceae bacterium]|nr:hemerythrin [Verrucomicrobiaceae bacterium]
MTTPRSASKTDSKTTAKTATTKAPHDAIALLKADHRLVEDLFEQYEKSKKSAKKVAIAKNICDELTVHAAIEEQAFYPKVKEALGDGTDLVNEAAVEHASLKWLIAQIQKEAPDSEFYDAKVKVLQEYVSHHVKEEEKEMFPEVKKSDLDIVALGDELQQLKAELKQKLVAH